MDDSSVNSRKRKRKTASTIIFIVIGLVVGGRIIAGIITQIPARQPSVESKASGVNNDSIVSETAKPKLTPMQQANERFMKVHEQNRKGISYDEESDSFVVAFRSGIPKSNIKQLFASIGSAAEDEPMRLTCKPDQIRTIVDNLEPYHFNRLNLTVKYVYDADVFTQLENLTVPTDLTLCGVNSINLSSLNQALPIKTLTWVLSPLRDTFLYYPPYKIELLDQLCEISFINDETGKFMQTNYDIAIICEMATQIPTIESINGQAAGEFNVSTAFNMSELSQYREHIALLERKHQDHLALIDQNKLLADSQEILDAASDYYERILEKFKAGEYTVSASQKMTGMAMLGKGIFSEANRSFFDTIILGRDFWGVSNSRFTVNPDECDIVILVYPEHEKVGVYTEGGREITNAYITKTVVSVVDIRNGTVSQPHVAATHEPSRTISHGKDNKGRFVPEEAIPYIIELFN